MPLISIVEGWHAFRTTISATSMPLSIAASATGGEVSIRAQKRPVATTSEAAIIENVRLVIVPSFVIGGPIPIKVECALPGLWSDVRYRTKGEPHAGAPRAMDAFSARRERDRYCPLAVLNGTCARTRAGRLGIFSDAVTTHASPAGRFTGSK